jgi:hypothetical protein
MPPVGELSSTVRIRTLTCWAIWVACLALWTVGLLTPYPEQVQQAGFAEAEVFTVSKTLHVFAYAGLTILSSWLGIFETNRRPILFLLCLHGVTTECLQNVVPTRTGTVRDALLDMLGIFLGLVFLRQVRGRLAHTPASDAAGDSAIAGVYPMPKQQPSAKSA